MPQRASQRRFGKSLKLHLGKQKKQSMKQRSVYREVCIEKENVCFEEARRESIKENENKAVDMSQDVCVKKPQSETGNKRLREPHKTRSAKRTSAAEQKREQRTHANPQKQLLSLLSSCPPHQLTQLQQTSPMLSSTTCQLKP